MKQKEIKSHYEYLGHIIWRNNQPGYHLRYSSLGVGAADTLAGMKRMVRENKGNK